MKKHEQFPLRSVECMPRSLMIGGVTLSVGCMLAGVGMAIYGLVIYGLGQCSGAQLGGALGGAFGCLIGGGGALFGTLASWRARMPATMLLSHLQNDTPTKFYRRVFWPALAVLVLGIGLGCLWNSRAIWHGLVQTSAMLAFASGSIEWARRHTVRQTRIAFALYADGVLDPDDGKKIDAARAKDPEFDAAVRTFQAVAARARDLQ